jgi:hypothetical protein
VGADQMVDVQPNATPITHDDSIVSDKCTAFADAIINYLSISRQINNAVGKAGPRLREAPHSSQKTKRNLVPQPALVIASYLSIVSILNLCDYGL